MGDRGMTSNVREAVGDTVHGFIGSLFIVGTTVASGAILLFVRTDDPIREGRALEILSKHGAFDPKVYEVPERKPDAA